MKQEQLILNIEQLGFSNKESKIYLALLELGQASLVETSRAARLKWTITHNLVKNLVQKGLVSEIQRGNRKIYTAVHPRRLLQIAQLHKQSAEQALPDLLALREKQVRRPDVQLYAGKAGVDQAYQEIQEALLKKQELLWISDMQAVIENVPDMVETYLKILDQKGVRRARELIVRNSAGTEYVARMLRRKTKSDIRFLPDALQLQNTEEAIIGDRLYHFILGEEPSVVVWEHPDVIQTRRTVFNYFWESAHSSVATS